MLGGITSLSLSSTTPQLLTQTQAQNALLRLTGALLASIVISPDTGVLMQGFYYFENLTTNSSFTITFTNSAGSVVLPQGRRGILWIDTTNGPRIMSSIGSSQTDILPAGTVQPFYNTAVPTGWTAVALNDYNLKIVSSGSGGVTSGSVDYSTLFGRTSVDATTLTEAQIPSHYHAAGSRGTFVPSGASIEVIVPPANGNFATTTSGSGQSHTHSLDMRVKTVALTLGTRN